MPAKLLRGLLELFDTAGALTQESRYGTEIKCRIEVAKDIFQKESIFDDKARQYLSFAYRMMTDGHKYESPEELDEFVTPAEAQEKVLKYARKLVDEALARIEEENKEEAAKLLLELVLMIVTTISV